MDTFKQVIYWLIANSLGGNNRIKILNSLFEKPQNANELSQNLDIDYKTVRYHLKLLIQNNFLTSIGSSYGKTYFISDKLEQNKEYYTKIAQDQLDKINK